MGNHAVAGAVHPRMMIDAPRITRPHVLVLAALAVPLGVFALSHHAAPRPALVFAGNRDIPSRALDQVVRTALHGHGPPYGADVLARASLELSTYYWDRGHAAVRIDPPRLGPADSIAFTIHEGPVFTLSSVDVVGVPAGEAAADRARLHDRAGRRFSRHAVVLDLHMLEVRHPGASVEPLSRFDPAHHTIALAFQIAR